MCHLAKGSDITNELSELSVNQSMVHHLDYSESQFSERPLKSDTNNSCFKNLFM